MIGVLIRGKTSENTIQSQRKNWGDADWGMPVTVGNHQELGRVKDRCPTHFKGSVALLSS